jgi:hypothetical protein
MSETNRWQCARCGHSQGQMHPLKTWPNFFVAILNGTKAFELRRNDRGFECGDTLRLQEWNPETGEYTGREVLKHVTAILTKHEGLADGFVLMSLVPA